MIYFYIYVCCGLANRSTDKLFIRRYAHKSEESQQQKRISPYLKWQSLNLLFPHSVSYGLFEATLLIAYKYFNDISKAKIEGLCVTIRNCTQ